MWITSKEQIQSATTDDLRRALLTCDGSGAAIKGACLTELIEREKAKLRAECLHDAHLLGEQSGEINRLREENAELRKERDALFTQAVARHTRNP